MDSTSKAQLVLPAVFKAIEDITKLSDNYEKYTNDLKVKLFQKSSYSSIYRLLG